MQDEARIKSADSCTMAKRHRHLEKSTLTPLLGEAEQKRWLLCNIRLSRKPRSAALDGRWKYLMNLKGIFIEDKSSGSLQV